MTSLELAKEAAKILDSKKGIDIQAIGVREVTTLADYFVLCTAGSTTQIKALADVCEKALKDSSSSWEFPLTILRGTAPIPGFFWITAM